MTVLDRSTLIALGAFMSSMQRSNIPLRRPSVQDPPYWGKPITLTYARPVPPTVGPDWVDLIVVPTRPDYYAMIQGYIATVQGDLSTAGIAYRFQLGDASLANKAQMPAGVELNKDSSTSYPAVPRPMFICVPNDSRLVLQYRNTSGISVNALAAIFGFYANSPDASTIDTKGITDV